MKKLLLFLLIFTCSYASPMWYHNVQKTKPNSYVGYGVGVDEVHAKQEAFNDIVSQISVSVSTSFSQKQRVEGKKFKNIQEFISSQNAKATLSDYALLKSEYSDGKYYVAVEYENIASFDKFVRKIKAGKSEARKSEAEATPPDGYLSFTLMAQKLRKALGRDIDFSLLRKDKKWYIKYGYITQALDAKGFANFFTTTLHVDLEINTNKRDNILYNEMKFFFKVKSKKSGFVSILSVYEDGTVSTLVRNIAIKKDRLENIPDEDFETIPEAGLMRKGIETYDLYVLVYSPKKLRFDSFAYADSELIEEEKYKNFDELIEFINDKTYTTLKVVTKPRMN